MSTTQQPFVVAPKALVKNAEGKYLFLRRSGESNHFAGMWEMPGGKMDPGENLEQCLVRETHEEASLDIQLLHVVGAAEGSIPAYRLAYIIVSASINGSEDVVLSSEHDQYVWVDAREAVQLDICPAFEPFVQSLCE